MATVLAVLVLVVTLSTDPISSTTLVVEPARLDGELAHLPAEPSAMLCNRRISRGTFWLPAQTNVAYASASASETAATDSATEAEALAEAALSASPHASGTDGSNGRVVNHGFRHRAKPGFQRQQPIRDLRPPAETEQLGARVGHQRPARLADRSGEAASAGAGRGDGRFWRCETQDGVHFWVFERGLSHVRRQRGEVVELLRRRAERRR